MSETEPNPWPASEELATGLTEYQRRMYNLTSRVNALLPQPWRVNNRRVTLTPDEIEEEDKSDKPPILYAEKEKKDVFFRGKNYRVVFSNQISSTAHVVSVRLYQQAGGQNGEDETFSWNLLGNSIDQQAYIYPFVSDEHGHAQFQAGRGDNEQYDVARCDYLIEVINACLRKSSTSIPDTNISKKFAAE